MTGASRLLLLPPATVGRVEVLTGLPIVDLVEAFDDGRATVAQHVTVAAELTGNDPADVLEVCTTTLQLHATVATLLGAIDAPDDAPDDAPGKGDAGG